MLLLVWGALTTPAAALADGDPASDILLVDNVFYPYTPATSVPLQRDLNGATAAAARAGVPIKVALIASPVDLGVITGLWDKPQQYASYLDDEISFTAPQPLLVVMRIGYGAGSLTARESAALAKLPLPVGATSDDLARAALTAVRQMAAAAGHPLALTAVASQPGGGEDIALAGVLGAVALMIAGGVSILTLRRRAPAAPRPDTRRRRR